MSVHNPSSKLLVWPLSRSLAATRKIDVSFSSSGYLDVSVPRVTFSWAILFTHGYLSITSSEFPHSEICGSMDICSLPQLIAACHVLRRLLVPRHPPCALLHLTKSVAWWRSSGLHLLQSNCYLTLSESFLFFWFLGLTLKLYSDLSEPTKFWKNTLVIFLDFVFVVNFCLYTIFTIQFSRYKWWRIRGSNPWPPACKAGALPAELIPHKLIV